MVSEEGVISGQFMLTYGEEGDYCYVPMVIDGYAVSFSAGADNLSGTYLLNEQEDTLVLSLVMVSSENASIFYVSTTGSDTNPGTAESPFLTIQKGIDAAAAVAGTEVRVAAGTYQPTTTIQIAAGVSILGGYSGSDWDDRKYQTVAQRNNPTYKTEIQYAGPYNGAYSPPVMDPIATISADGAEVTASTKVEGFTIKARDTGVATAALLLQNSAALTVQYNTINGSTNTSAGSVAVASNGSEPTMDNNVIDAGSSDGVAMGIYAIASEITFTNNTVTGGTSAGGTTGLNLENVSGIIANNVISGGSASSDVAQGIRIADGTPSSILIYNNTISSGSSTGAGNNALKIDNTSQVTVYSNVIIGEATGPAGTSFTVMLENCSTGLYNNTIIGGTSMVENIAVQMLEGATPTIENNIIYTATPGTVSKGIYESDAESDPISVRNNNINGFSGKGYYDFDSSSYWSPSGPTWYGSIAYGNIAVPPSFVDYGNKDFHLTGASHVNLRGGGKDLTAVIGVLDKDGVTRTTGTPVGMTNTGASGWSIGAYEID